MYTDQLASLSTITNTKNTTHTQNSFLKSDKKVCVIAQFKVHREVIGDRLQKSNHVFMNQPNDRSVPSVAYPTFCFTSLDRFKESVSFKKKPIS